MPAAMARRHLLTLVVMTVALAFSAAFASAAAAGGLRIVRPANGRFLVGAPVHVRVEAPRSVGSLHLTLDGKGVSGRLRRVKPGVWQGTLARKQVRVGVDQLDAVARIKGRQAQARSIFTIGRRNRKLLTVLPPPRRARAVAARVRVGKKPEKLVARLNGKRLRWPVGVARNRRELLRLGADDGLHYGVNHLRVTAIRGGVYDVERRDIRVPRNRPLVGAGRDRRTVAGAKVHLDGSSSRAAGPGKLRYRWKIVRKPKGSKAKLKGAAKVRPVLTTDRPGNYRVALTVTEPGSEAPGATDVVTASAVPKLQPIGEPIETIAYNGENTEETADTGIKVGSTTYWMGMPQGNSIQAVILERGTLEVLYHASFKGTAEDAKTLEEAIKEYGEKALVVISNPDFFENQVSTAFVPIVKSLGVSKEAVASLQLGRDGWSVIGVPGVKGSAYFGNGSNYRESGAGQVRGDLIGYLEESLSPEGKHAFAFVPGERVSFDTSVPGTAELHNTIAIGGSDYASQPLPPCATGGFQVEVVLAETLAPVEGQTFTTDGCPGNATEIEKMAAMLKGVVLTGGQTEGNKLVFVQGIGSPYPINEGVSAQWDAVAAQIARLGGTGQVFAAAKYTWAFVGGLGISRLPLTEASQSLTGQVARITGVLEPEREDSFVPVLSSPTGAVPFELSTIAYQAPQPWPESQSAEQKAALAYADEYLELETPRAGAACSTPGPGEQWLYLRAEYCNLRYETQWAAMGVKLERAQAPAGKGFTEETWEGVTSELATEFGDVQSVWKMVGILQGAFGTSSVTADVNLEEIGLAIEKDLRVPEKSEVAGWWLEMAANIASIISYYDFGVPDEVVQKTSGTLSGGLFIAAQLTIGPQGAPEAEEFDIVAKEFAGQLAERYLRASSGLGYIGELLVSDHGKLAAVSASGLLGIDAARVSELEQQLGPGSKAWSYERLMPSAFEAVGLEAQEPANSPLPSNANEYRCTVVAETVEENYKPFNASAEAQMHTTEPNESLGVLVVKGSTLPGGGSGAEEHPVSPKAELLEPIFKSPTELKGALGLKAPWFWRTAFDYPSAANRTVKCRGVN